METLNSITNFGGGFFGVVGVCFFLIKPLGMCMYLVMTKGYPVNTVIFVEVAGYPAVKWSFSLGRFVIGKH